MWSWLSSVFNGLLRGIESIGALLFDFGNAVVALFTSAGTVLGLLVQILWQIANVVTSLVGGLLATLRSISSPAYSWGATQPGASHMANAIGLEAIGWALAGIIWLIIAVSVLRAASSRH